MEVDLHVTNRCNLRCMHCVYSSGEWKMDDITLKTVSELIPSLQKLGVEEVHITGGEPLLNPELFCIISLLSDSGFDVRMQSNGMLLDQSRAQQLREAGLRHILISVDGLRDRHNAFRKNECSFDRAIEAAKVCMSCDLFTRINTVLYQDNLQDIEGLLDLTSAMGVDLHSFFYLTPIGRGRALAPKVLSLSLWKKIHERIEAYAESIGFSDRVKVQNVYRETLDMCDSENLCRRDNCLVLANGDVFSCVFFIESPYKMGNIFDSDLEGIWSRSKIWETLSASRKRMSFGKGCSGGCPGLTYLFTGTIDESDPLYVPGENLISGCVRQYVEKTPLV